MDSNWHWIEHPHKEDANKYLQKSLIGISAEKGGVSARITRVTIVDEPWEDGTSDATVAVRRGHVKTYYDIKLRLEFEGKKLASSTQHVPGAWIAEGSTGESNEEESISGSIFIPDVSQIVPENPEKYQYTFNIDIVSDSSGKQSVKDLIRDEIDPQIRTSLDGLLPELAKFGEGHKKTSRFDATSDTATPTSNTNITKPLLASSKPSSQKSTKPSPKASNGPLVNTTTLIDTEEFRTTAAELYKTFTDRPRLAAFTRSDPTVFEGAHPGGKFALFGGNVSGLFTELNEPTKIVQQWRLKQWPEGHYSRLEIGFNQNDSDGVTVMNVKWDGVPVGQEEVTRTNWNERYVKSIKITFGFGTVIS